MSSNNKLTFVDKPTVDLYPCPFCGKSSLSNETHDDECYFKLSEAYRADGALTAGQAQKLADAWKVRSYPAGYVLAPLNGSELDAYLVSKNYSRHLNDEVNLKDEKNVLRAYHDMLKLISEKAEINVDGLICFAEFNAISARIKCILSLCPELKAAEVEKRARRVSRSEDGLTVIQVLEKWLIDLLEDKQVPALK